MAKSSAIHFVNGWFSGYIDTESKLPKQSFVR